MHNQSIENNNNKQHHRSPLAS